MSAPERVVRVLAGALGGPLAAALLAAPASGAAAAALWGLIGVTALDLVVSGLVGFCPVYRYVRAPWAPRDGT